MTLLAILGRGIQQRSTEDPTWEPTPDLEVCDEIGAHLRVRVPEDDSNPNSIIGGSELNILAGILLAKQLDPSVIVCAYGARSKYLNEIEAPSESQIMSEKISDAIKQSGGKAPTIEVFDENKWPNEATGTNQELQNIFAQAAQLKISNVAILTVAVHVPRATLMAQQFLSSHPEWHSITLQCYASEMVLIKNDADKYRDRVHKIFASQSYIRNWEREMTGINKLLTGNYKNISSTIT